MKRTKEQIMIDDLVEQCMELDEDYFRIMVVSRYQDMM